MSEDRPDSSKRTRLDALKTLGAAAAGAVAGSLIGKESASAGNGAALVVGETTNTAEDQTKLTMDGTLNTSAFVVAAAKANAAIEGNSSSIGVLGNATTGVMGVGDVGGVFSGDANAVQLNPQRFAGESIPASDTHLKGDMLVDANGVLWLCVADGTPGTWIRASHGGVRLLSQPQRAYDSRNTGGTFSNTEVRNIAIAGAISGVPSNALGLVGNVTITETVGGGYLTIWPAGQTQPITSNINWSTDNMTVANSFNIAVGSGGAISVVTVGTRGQTAQVIVDITGYVL